LWARSLPVGGIPDAGAQCNACADGDASGDGDVCSGSADGHD
jgi:hypothetical protein